MTNKYLEKVAAKLKASFKDVKPEHHPRVAAWDDLMKTRSKDPVMPRAPWGRRAVAALAAGAVIAAAAKAVKEQRKTLETNVDKDQLTPTPQELAQQQAQMAVAGQPKKPSAPKPAVKPSGNKYLQKAAGLFSGGEALVSRAAVPLKAARSTVNTAVGKGSDMAAANLRMSRVDAVRAGRMSQLNNIATGGKAQQSLNGLGRFGASGKVKMDAATENMRQARIRVAKAVGIGAAGAGAASLMGRGFSRENNSGMDLSAY